MADIEKESEEQVFLAIRSVARRYGVSQATVWAWLAEGNFPQPIRLSSGCTRWHVEDLRRWERNLKAAQTGGMTRTK